MFKQLREDIAELSGLSTKQIDDIAAANLGAIKTFSENEKGS
jgi:hypothetical protein